MASNREQLCYLVHSFIKTLYLKQEARAILRLAGAHRITAGPSDSTIIHQESIPPLPNFFEMSNLRSRKEP